MRENLFWMAVGLVGLFCGVMHFHLEPVLLAGRVWDGVVGAAVLGNLVMLVVSGVRILDERDRRRGRRAK
jgi:uncharacterized integral membrane protein